MTAWCSSCRLGGELKPLAGTELAFCRNCASVVGEMAAHMASKGLDTETIIEKIKTRYTPK